MSAPELFTVEGLESDYDSKGMGLSEPGVPYSMPKPGERFLLWSRDGSVLLLRTSMVRHTRELPGGVHGFQTEHTTYLLRPAEGRS